MAAWFWSVPSEFWAVCKFFSTSSQLSISAINCEYWRVPATVCANAVCWAFVNVSQRPAVSSKISLASLNSPLTSRTFTPTVSNACEYLFKSTPSSNVSPSFKPCNLANKVLNAVPTTSALWRVFATTAAKAEVAYSYERPTVSPIEANFSRPSAISFELEAVLAPRAVMTSA